MKQTAQKSLPLLGLIEMGRLGEVAIRIVAANLQALIGFSVDILDRFDVPAEAFQRHRQQYDGGLIIQHLRQLSLPDHARILAVTTVDLCTPILTYVFGEAEVGGRAAVVSNFRLRSNEDGGMVPLDRYYERLAKVALHEIAHTLSVYHCEDVHCLMHFTARVEHLDRLEIAFCKRCEFTLRESLKHLLIKHKP
jgi:archaemetzincin